MNDGMDITFIGTFHCLEKFPYDVPRQGILAGDNIGAVKLLPEYADCLRELDSFSHIWLLYAFHRNSTWHPLIMPPRHRTTKVGVFASRSPYRPNSIGMSCVKLIGVSKGEILISGHDLLDGTPIIDIKPYLPYADAFPNASPGWTAEGNEQTFAVAFTPLAEKQLLWLEEHQGGCIRSFTLDRLSTSPLDKKRTRLLNLTPDGATLAYRTWRLDFTVAKQTVTIQRIYSGYSPAELEDSEDKYGDKPLHRKFSDVNFQV